MNENLEVERRIVVVCGDNEFNETRDGLVVEVLTLSEMRDIKYKKRDSRRTRMSITNTSVENTDRETPRVSTVMLPGQSHISKGMIVLEYSYNEIVCLE